MSYAKKILEKELTKLTNEHAALLSLQETMKLNGMPVKMEKINEVKQKIKEIREWINLKS